MSITTASRDALIAAINAIPLVDVAAMQATIDQQAETIETLTLESAAAEAKLINARLKAVELISGIDA